MLSSEVASGAAVEKTGLEHRIHLPRSAAANRTVIMVHGRAGNSQLMWSFSAAFSKFDPFAVAPQAFLVDEIGGWSWWTVDPTPDTTKARQTTYEQLEPALEKLEKFIERLPEVYERELGEVYAIGFSQGAAMVGTLSLRRPELFRGVGMLAGFLPKIVLQENAFVHPSIRVGGSGLPRYFLAHGSEDKVIPVNRAEWARDFFIERGAEAELVTDLTGHKVGATGMRALRGWFERMFADWLG